MTSWMICLFCILLARVDWARGDQCQQGESSDGICEAAAGQVRDSDSMLVK